MVCDILNLEWSSSGRDREVATLICHTLRKKGYSVIEASIFHYRYYLIKYQPKLLYAADPKGAALNYQAVRFAHGLGIPVVTVTAEGDYKPEQLERMFWGHISDKRLIENLNLQWSSRARNMILDLVDSSLADQVKISGAVGFDRYHVYQFYKKEDWMRKYGCDYPNMIGYAGWGFDAFHRNDKWASTREQLYGQQQIEQFCQECLEVNKILKQLIEQNQDKLFLLKEHPGVTDSSKTELAGLSAYPNVIYVKNEEAIADCISGCDVWMAFESTTCLEAWLLGKPTILINPFGGDFVRSHIFQGSPILRSFDEIQGMLDTYFLSRTVPKFEAKQEARRRIIENTIQWADGRNHLRAAHLIEKVLLESAQRNIRIKISDRIEASWHNILFEGSRLFPSLPRFRYYAAARRRFRQSELEELTRRYAPHIELFHRENPLTEQDIEELEKINS